jgi:hypothetical protein
MYMALFQVPTPSSQGKYVAVCSHGVLHVRLYSDVLLVLVLIYRFLPFKIRNWT